MTFFFPHPVSSIEITPWLKLVVGDMATMHPNPLIQIRVNSVVDGRSGCRRISHATCVELCSLVRPRKS